ncbi:YitT family protein [Paenibacillus silviterrae]|uniref:YitT family protein n=1 Tax=Paenibacillus silviterrae TaxID=3242194 RepID=UPI002543E455|nr:YitT family protein [Paenibacillus chinjuensis]
MDRPLLNKLYTYGCITIGSLLIALSFNLLQNPNGIATGGVPGLSTLVEHYTGWAPAWIGWSINLLLLGVGWLTLGGSFAGRTVFGSFILPLLILVTDDLPTLTHNPLLASIYGGIGTGLGLGLIFRVKGSTGGLTIVALLLQRFFGVTLANGVIAMDLAILAAGAAAFSPEHALYAAAGLFFSRKLIPVSQGLHNRNRFAMIISRRPEKVRSAVLEHLDRGLTELSGKGGYTGLEQNVLMVVLLRSEVNKLKRLLAQADPEAFVMIGDAEEVMGDGFDRFQAATPRSIVRV